MAVATSLLVAAGLSAAAGIGGAALSSSAQNKAAKTAATAQTQNTAQNNALQRELYGYNTANFQPYLATGGQAMGTLNGLLFGQPQQGQQGQQPSALYGNPDGSISSGGLRDPRTLLDGAPGQDGGNPLGGYGAPMAAPQGAVTAPNATNAWDQFRNSTNYQFRLNEGQRNLNQGYAGIGALNSGAAVKDSIKYGQEFAGNELARYMSLLQGQQNLGFGGAQALAGVSNNYGNNVQQNNNNAADAVSNAALLRGQANSQLYGGIAGSLGNLAGSFATSFPKGFG